MKNVTKQMVDGL